MSSIISPSTICVLYNDARPTKTKNPYLPHEIYVHDFHWYKGALAGRRYMYMSMVWCQMMIKRTAAERFPQQIHIYIYICVPQILKKEHLRSKVKSLRDWEIAQQESRLSRTTTSYLPEAISMEGKWSYRYTFQVLGV